MSLMWSSGKSNHQFRKAIHQKLSNYVFIMYLNGMGLRGIERVTEIHHTTIMNWIEEAGAELPDTPEEEEIPEITEIDELQTFIGNKRNKVWIGSVVNHWQPGILLWTVGDWLSASARSAIAVVKHLRIFG